MPAPPARRTRLAVALALLLAPPIALAQDPAPAPAPSSTPGESAAMPEPASRAGLPRQPMAIDIRAQPLADALNAWARQTGLQVIAAQPLVAGRDAPAVVGQMTPLQALDRLLGGSGLGHSVEGNAVIIREARSGASTPMLPAVTVRANVSAETADGQVNGYVAQRSATASRADIPLVETAQTINVITADEIAIQNSSSVADALRYTAGANPMGGGLSNVSDTMILRGFNIGFNPLYLNGARLSRNTFVGTAEPYAMERIELLKGPASVMYGTSVPGGVISMVSKLPQRDAARELQVQLGSDRHRQLAGDFTGSLNDSGTLSYRITGLVRRSDTYVDHIPNDRDFLQASLRWQPTAATSLTLLAAYQNNASVYAYGLPPEGVIEPNPNGRIPRSRFVGEPGFDRYQTINRTFSWLLRHEINDSLSFRQTFLGYVGRANYSNIWIGALDANERVIARGVDQRTSSNHSWSLDNHLEARWRTGAVEHTTLVGLDISRVGYDLLTHNGTVAPLDLFAPVYGAPVAINAQPIRNYRTSGQQLGLYVQQHMKLDGRWVLSLAGRFDTFREDQHDRLTGERERSFDDDATTGRIGLVRLFDNGWAPYLSYTQSFEPSSGQDFAGTPFKPTRGDQVELGVRYQPNGSRHSVRASLYQINQSNVTTTDPANPSYSIQVGEVRSRGLELEARANLASGLNLIATWAYTDNEVTRSNAVNLGRRYAGVPKQMATLWLDYQATAALTVGGGYRYYGSTTNLANSVSVPSFQVVDAVVSYQLSRPWKLALNLSNLLDERYATCTYACFYGEPRKAMATLSYRW